MARRGEFALIQSLFAPLAGRSPWSLGLTDDAAILEGGPQDTVASVDALVAGVHFLPSDPAESIAAKALRVNLSDLAAMGATPVGVLLALALPPGVDDPWLEAFARGLDADLRAFDLALLGGDTVSTPGPLTLSVTILGRTPPGAALRRAGARPGDDLWVSGTLGDGALGLRVAQGGLPGLPGALREVLLERYRRPQPRVGLGVALRGVAGGCLDLSDGLCADAAHLARASGVGIEIESPLLPLSEAAATLIADDPDLFACALGGGDDYELLFSAPPSARAAVAATATTAGVALTRIGRVTTPEADGPGVRVLDGAGLPFTPAYAGWTHDG